jgi:hypothetical protein
MLATMTTPHFQLMTKTLSMAETASPTTVPFQHYRALGVDAPGGTMQWQRLNNLTSRKEIVEK